MANESKITTDLEVDDPLLQDANHRFDEDDRQYIDNQVRGLQRHLVRGLIRGVHGTYALSDATFAAGDVVCIATSSSEYLIRIVKATTANLATAGAALGVVTTAVASGSMAFVALLGVLPPSITGLPAGAIGDAIVNSSGRLEYKASADPGDVVAGRVSAAGFLTIRFE